MSQNKHLDIKLSAVDQAPQQNEAAVFFVRQKGDKAYLPGAPDWAEGLLSSAEGWQGAGASSRLFRNAQNSGGFKHVLFVGLGKDLGSDALRQGAATAYKILKEQLLSVASFFYLSQESPWDAAQAVKQFAEGADLCAYSFDVHMQRTSSKPFALKIHLRVGAIGAKLDGVLGDARILSEQVNFAKYLADQPGNKMPPRVLAEEVQKQAQGTGLKVEVWDKARILKESMGGLYGVGLGSDEEPRFIIMEYSGGVKGEAPVCLVGKGLTFDSGGISLKPGLRMDEMKYDMCGGTAVIGAMMAIARLKPKVNVLGLVPSSENMPGPMANKPGDILKARNGKTVEVLNTDAEGRLILMDALSYACEQKPRVIFDAATLTGAMVVALGNTYTGFFTRSEKLAERVKRVCAEEGELVWPMPIHDHFVQDMKGRHADLANISSGRGAGSGTAAAFLEQFVDSDTEWAHFDIAGTAYNCGNRLSYCRSFGATGAMVRSFVALVSSY